MDNVKLFTIVFWVIWLAFVVVVTVAEWKLFSMAGEPGWACLVPFYNFWIICKIAYNNGLMMLTLFIPLVNFVMAFLTLFKFGKAYGKSTGFCIGLMFLSPIFIPMMAFSSDTDYVGA